MKKMMQLIAVLALLGLALPALGHGRTLVDEDEGDFIDIESVVQAHPAEPPFRSHFVSFRIDTYQPFTNAELLPPEGDNEAVAIGVSTDGDHAFERVILVRAEEDAEAASGYAPYAYVTAGKRQQDADSNTFTPRRNFLGYAKVTRPTEDSVKVIVNERLLKKGGVDTFRWMLRFVSSEPGSGEINFDYVPNLRLARGHSSE